MAEDNSPSAPSSNEPMSLAPIQVIGALDFLPKTTFASLDDEEWWRQPGSDAAFMYWGPLLVTTDHAVNLLRSVGPDVLIVDMVSATALIVKVNLRPDNAPVAIGRGASPAVFSSAEIMPDCNGLGWFHFCAPASVRAGFVAAVTRLRQNPHVTGVFCCPSLVEPHRVLELAFDLATLPSAR